MRRHFEREIDNLKKEILSMGTLVEGAIGKALTAVYDRDGKLGEEIIRADDELDELELRIEEECLKVLALYNPVASDLRFIIAVVKINGDLERMGDLAVNIAERAVYLAERPPLDPPEELKQFSELARGMVNQALAALVSGDSDLALKVTQKDEQADEMHRTVSDGLQQQMTRNPENIDRLLPFLGVSRQLERICDHATNIAEDVYYLARGDIIRHHAREYSQKAGIDGKKE